MELMFHAHHLLQFMGVSVDLHKDNQASASEPFTFTAV